MALWFGDWSAERDILHPQFKSSEASCCMSFAISLPSFLSSHCRLNNKGKKWPPKNHNCSLPPMHQHNDAVDFISGAVVSTRCTSQLRPSVADVIKQTNLKWPEYFWLCAIDNSLTALTTQISLIYCRVAIFCHTYTEYFIICILFITIIHKYVRKNIILRVRFAAHRVQQYLSTANVPFLCKKLDKDRLYSLVLKY